MDQYQIINDRQLNKIMIVISQLHVRKLVSHWGRDCFVHSVHIALRLCELIQTVPVFRRERVMRERIAEESHSPYSTPLFTGISNLCIQIGFWFLSFSLNLGIISQHHMIIQFFAHGVFFHTEAACELLKYRLLHTCFEKINAGCSPITIMLSNIIRSHWNLSERIICLYTRHVYWPVDGVTDFKHRVFRLIIRE